MCIFLLNYKIEHLFKINLFFYWRIIVLQNFVVFCQTSTWISHKYTYIPLPFEPPSHLPPHPTPLGWYRAPVWVFWALQQVPTGYLFYIWWYSFHVTLSIHLTLSSPLPMSKNLSSMSVSPLLLCKQILQYHFSRFHKYALEYDVYLSLSDFPHSV